MKTRIFVLAASLLLSAQSNAEVGQAQDGAQCNRLDQVGYEAVNPDRLRDIELVRVEPRSAQQEAIRLRDVIEIVSPHRTARLLVHAGEDGDRRSRTTIYFFTQSPEPSAMRATFRNHRNEVRPRWINEKLAFVEVWWGRVRSTELIVDVEKGTSMYMQDADYFGMTLPRCE